jgi:transposase
MGAAYSQDLRDRVIAARDRGMKTKQVADLFNVSPAWVRRVIQRLREQGETSPRPRGGVTVVKIDMDRLRELVEAQPEATVRELHQRLGVDCSVSAVDMALRRMNLSFKKRRSMPPNRIGPTSPSVANSGVTSNPSAMPAG